MQARPVLNGLFGAINRSSVDQHAAVSRHDCEQRPPEAATTPSCHTGSATTPTTSSCHMITPSPLATEVARSSDAETLARLRIFVQSLVQALLMSPHQITDHGARSRAVADVVRLHQSVHSSADQYGVAKSACCADPFLIVLYRIFGSAEDAADFCNALGKLPIAGFVWRAFSARSSQAAPMLLQLHAVRHMLALEDRAVYVALSDVGVLDAAAALWLRWSLLRVLPLEACTHVVALSLACGPFVAPALLVAALRAAREGVLQHALYGDLLPWVLGLTFADMDVAALLADAERMHRTHRSGLLEVLQACSA